MSRFRSTPPQGGATLRASLAGQAAEVSIHAPAGGGDLAPGCSRLRKPRFDPRPRRGGRHRCAPGCSPPNGFDPRPRRGGRHDAGGPVGLGVQVSIHAPAGGGDHGGYLMVSLHPRFDPRPRRGGRLLEIRGLFLGSNSFRSTPPQGGATVHCRRGDHGGARFDPRPRRGGRRLQCNVARRKEKNDLRREPRCSSIACERILVNGCVNSLILRRSEPSAWETGAWSSHQTSRRPSGSAAGLAPTCSTRRRHSFPRK